MACSLEFLVSNVSLLFSTTVYCSQLRTTIIIIIVHCLIKLLLLGNGVTCFPIGGFNTAFAA